MTSVNAEPGCPRYLVWSGLRRCRMEAEFLAETGYSHFLDYCPFPSNARTAPRGVARVKTVFRNRDWPLRLSVTPPLCQLCCSARYGLLSSISSSRRRSSDALSLRVPFPDITALGDSHRRAPFRHRPPLVGVLALTVGLVDALVQDVFSCEEIAGVHAATVAHVYGAAVRVAWSEYQWRAAGFVRRAGMRKAVVLRMP